MVITGIGLGMSLPLFMLAVQNAVPHRVMGVSTSTMQFLRSVGGTMGVAVMGSMINSSLSSGLVANMPAQVRETAQPSLLQQLSNPQFLLNPQQREGVRGAFEQFGPQGSQLFEASILAVKTSLATAIADAFWMATFVVLAAVLVGVFLREVPLRRVHELEGAPLAAEPDTRAALAPVAVAPVAGGANGGARRRPLVLAAAVGAGAAFVAVLLAFLIRRGEG